MKKNRIKKWKSKIVATLMIMIFAIPTPGLRTYAEESEGLNEDVTTTIVSTYY